jgi:hypothetical protein
MCFCRSVVFLCFPPALSCGFLLAALQPLALPLPSLVQLLEYTVLHSTPPSLTSFTLSRGVISFTVYHFRFPAFFPFFIFPFSLSSFVLSSFPFLSMSTEEEKQAAIDEAEKAVEQWKVKRLITTLEACRGNGTSMISLIIPPKDQIARVSKMLADELGTATNM